MRSRLEELQEWPIITVNMSSFKISKSGQGASDGTLQNTGGMRQGFTLLYGRTLKTRGWAPFRVIPWA